MTGAAESSSVTNQIKHPKGVSHTPEYEQILEELCVAIAGEQMHKYESLRMVVLGAHECLDIDDVEAIRLLDTLSNLIDGTREEQLSELLSNQSNPMLLQERELAGLQHNFRMENGRGIACLHLALDIRSQCAICLKRDSDELCTEQCPVRASLEKAA